MTDCGWCWTKDGNHNPYCQRPEVIQIGQIKYYKLLLNEYQRNNLLWLFEVCSQFNGFNTGDWFGEIPEMLAPGTRKLAPGEFSNIPVEAGVKYVKIGTECHLLTQLEIERLKNK